MDKTQNRRAVWGQFKGFSFGNSMGTDVSIFFCDKEEFDKAMVTNHKHGESFQRNKFR